MNREDRVKLLAESITEANRKAAQELAEQRETARLTASVQAQLAPLLAAHKAESGREITCPLCNGTFTTNWRTDDVTSVKRR